jgi:hypothetical protein
VLYGPQDFAPVHAQTDANGLFLIKASGKTLTLTLEKWSHPGWDFWNGGGGMQSSFDSWSSTRGLTEHSSPESAYIYEMVPAGSVDSKWIMDRHYVPPIPK